MEGDAFDDLVKRLSQARLTRVDALRGVLASAAVGLIGARLVEETAATTKGKAAGKKGGRKPQGHGRRGDAHKADTRGTVHAEGKKKKLFCLCPGDIAANCTPTHCVNCVSQGKIGKNKLQQIKQDNPLSFQGDCPAPPPVTTTTLGVCGGACQVGTATCAQFGSTCVCRGTSVIPGSIGICTTAPGTCAGQSCIAGAGPANQCVGLGTLCTCIASTPGGQGVCGVPAVTTTTAAAPPTTPPCVSNGGGCANDTECCDFLFCIAGRCQTCVSNGGGCANDTECCDFFNCIAGRCQIP
jgi:hypothetical protein